HQTTPLVQPHQTTNLSETAQHPEASWIPYPHQAKSSHTVNHASLAVLFLSIIQGLICLSIEMLPVSPIMVKAASSSRSVHRQISNQWVFSLKSVTVTWLSERKYVSSSVNTCAEYPRAKLCRIG